MVYLGYIALIVDKHPVLILQNNKMTATSLCLLLPAQLTFYLIFFFKYSIFFKQATLCDLGGYEAPVLHEVSTSFATILWYMFKTPICENLLIFSIATSKTHKSIELLFRNARWLEREASEFFNIFFEAKTDRRALFTIPLFYNFPLRKKYPTGGFYEIFFCPTAGRLQWKSISWQN